MQEFSEIDRYYRDHFAEVNYQGVSGWASSFQHRELERDLRSRHFSQVLEVGVAHGHHLGYVQHTYDRYFLTDLVDRNIDLDLLAEQAPSRQSLQFVTADVESLPFADASIDRILCTCLFHHLKDPESGFREIQRVLKPEGLATLYLPCDPGLLYMTTQRFTTRRRQERVLRSGGFEFGADYLRAKEHPGHFQALRAIARHVFGDSKYSESYWPLRIPLWNLNFFVVLRYVK